MKNLTFKYGTVGAAKTLDLLVTRHQWNENHERPSFLITPAIDYRYGTGVVRSRAGLEANADFMWPDAKHYNLLWKQATEIVTNIAKSGKVGIVLVDEAQFFSGATIDFLRAVTKHVPVVAYGLKTDFRDLLFAGSKRLLEVADIIQEIPSKCIKCDNNAKTNARKVEGNYIFAGEQLDIGGTYEALCREHYIEAYREWYED